MYIVCGVVVGRGKAGTGGVVGQTGTIPKVTARAVERFNSSVFQGRNCIAFLCPDPVWSAPHPQAAFSCAGTVAVMRVTVVCTLPALKGHVVFCLWFPPLFVVFSLADIHTPCPPFARSRSVQLARGLQVVEASCNGGVRIWLSVLRAGKSPEYVFCLLRFSLYVSIVTQLHVHSWIMSQ